MTPSDVIHAPTGWVHHALLQDPRVKAPPAGHVARGEPFRGPFRDDAPFQDEPLRVQTARIRINPPIDHIDGQNVSSEGVWVAHKVR